MTTKTKSDLIPISQAYHGQILDQLRAGPKTAADLAKVFRPQWFKSEPTAATEIFQDRLAEMCETGDVREVGEGLFELCPVSDDPDEATEATGELSDGDSGAIPTGGAAETDTEETDVATQAPKKRGRKPKSESNGSAPTAAKTQKTLPPDGEEIAGHLGAIERVENELAEAKISYEDCLNVRRLKKAALDVAKSERRRFSVHEGSNLEQIKSAQKAVDKCEKQFNEAQANALEAKNRVNSVEEKLARTIAGEMPLFEGDEDGDEGDDE